MNHSECKKITKINSDISDCDNDNDDKVLEMERILTEDDEELSAAMPVIHGSAPHCNQAASISPFSSKLKLHL